jgi:hypothetical protein
MKRVELHARLKSVQGHDLYRGKDITTLTAFMDNTELEKHIEGFEKGIGALEKTGRKALNPGAKPKASAGHKGRPDHPPQAGS